MSNSSFVISGQAVALTAALWHNQDVCRIRKSDGDHHAANNENQAAFLGCSYLRTEHENLRLQKTQMLWILEPQDEALGDQY